MGFCEEESVVILGMSTKRNCAIQQLEIVMRPLFLIAVLVCSIATVFAQDGGTAQQAQTPAVVKPSTATPGVTKRQVRQRARIRQGVRTGELTPGEAAKLRGEQRKIKADKQAAKADGKVTPAERKQLQKEQNKSSRDIYRLKHNNVTR